MTREEALRLRAKIERAAMGLADEDALEAVCLFPTWNGAIAYAEGDRVRFDGVLYRCLQAHLSQPEWSPDVAASLWGRVLIPDPASIPTWEQPDSTNPYRTGDRVAHKGRIWVSILDNNIWEPGVYGWDPVST